MHRKTSTGLGHFDVSLPRLRICAKPNSPRIPDSKIMPHSVNVETLAGVAGVALGVAKNPITFAPASV